jgi:hypothetical protein
MRASVFFVNPVSQIYHWKINNNLINIYFTTPATKLITTSIISIFKSYELGYVPPIVMKNCTEINL